MIEKILFMIGVTILVAVVIYALIETGRHIERYKNEK